MRTEKTEGGSPPSRLRDPATQGYAVPRGGKAPREEGSGQVDQDRRGCPDIWRLWGRFLLEGAGVLKASVGEDDRAYGTVQETQVSADNAMCQPVGEVAKTSVEEVDKGPELESNDKSGLPTAFESERIRTVLASLMRISLSNDALGEQLRQVLELIFSIPWLALEGKGAIFLVEEVPELLVMKAQMNLAVPLLDMCARVPFGHCLCGRAACSAAVEYADCVDHRHDNRYEGMTPHGHYVVPIVSRGKVLGVLNL